MRKPLAAAALAVLLAGCAEENPKRGLEILPDMFHTPAFKSQTALVSPDGTVQSPATLAPPEGTVPREGAPYPLAANEQALAKGFANPLAPLPAVLRAGRRDFETYCGVCHGRDGNAGHAPMAPFFSGIPSLAGETYSALTDGEIAHIIARGRGRMPGHAAQLPGERRWQVVSYLRALQHATVATARGGKELEALMAVTGGERLAPLPAPRPEYEPPAWPGAEAKP
ncbi:MAG: cytochrome c [Planctomycetes bacterium]|nr:cytochrome c [Planctomycetota bacterium]